MERPPLAHLNPTDPARLARDTAYELVRAAVAVAGLCAERPAAPTAEALVDELTGVIAERLLAMMEVFDPDDLNTTILHVGEAIDQLGFGDVLDLRDVPALLGWADPEAVAHDEPAAGEDLARAELLRAGVVVLEDHTVRGSRTITASGPSADATRAAIAEVAPRATVDWAGPAPRRLVPVPCDGYRPRDGDALRVYVRWSPTPTSTSSSSPRTASRSRSSRSSACPRRPASGSSGTSPTASRSRDPSATARSSTARPASPCRTRGVERVSHRVPFGATLGACPLPARGTP